MKILLMDCCEVKFITTIALVENGESSLKMWKSNQELTLIQIVRSYTVNLCGSEVLPAIPKLNLSKCSG